MSFYENVILPRLMNLMMANKYATEERKKTLAPVRGTVLEVGFGSGRNLPWYPPGVLRVVGVDPSRTSAKLARKRIAAAPFPVEYVAATGEEIAAPDHSFDCVVSTFTLCTIPDPALALRQMSRVLKPGRQAVLRRARPVDRSEGSEVATSAQPAAKPRLRRLQHEPRHPRADRAGRLRIRPGRPVLHERWSEVRGLHDPRDREHRVVRSERRHRSPSTRSRGGRDWYSRPLWAREVLRGVVKDGPIVLEPQPTPST